MQPVGEEEDIPGKGEQVPFFYIPQQEDESDVILGHAVLQPPGEVDV